MLNSIINKFKKSLIKLANRVPYVPDFNNVWNIVRICLISYTLCFIYSFLKVERASQFYIEFIFNIKIFTIYLFVQILFLIFLSNTIKKIPVFFSLMLMYISNFLTIYLIYSVLTNSFSDFFYNLDKSITIYVGSFAITSFFLIYFDWRMRAMMPANSIAKLSFLQSKMRPHFFFNTINSIIYLIKSNPEVAKKMLLNLTDILRVSLNDESIIAGSTIRDEINLANKYLEIEKIRLEERLNIIWDIDDKCLEYKIPKLILQPLIENAVIHGIQTLEYGGNVNIKISQSLIGKISIEIKNPYFIKESLDKSNGNNISLQNLQERLNIYYEGDANLYIKKDINIFYIILTLPEKNSYF